MTTRYDRRELLGRTAALAAAAAESHIFAAGLVRANDSTSSKLPWYRTTLAGIEIGPTGANRQDPAYMSRATGKEIVDRLREAHAEYGVIFMKDMEFAYYNSKIAKKCPGLGSRDLLKECLDEAKKYNLPIVAYCQVQYDHSSWRAHPEWRMQGADGKDLENRLCFNSGYLDFIKQVLAEMMDYPIVGFHVDMLDFGFFGGAIGCFCPRCRELFRKKYSVDMPKGVTWDENWDRMLQFRCDSNTHFCQEVQKFVYTKRPGLSVDFNYHGYPPFSWYPGQKPVQHARNGDFVTCEPLPWIFGHNTPSLLSLFLAGARPEGPWQVATSRGVRDYHDLTVRPVAEMMWEVFTYFAHGVQCTMVDKLYYDGSTDPLAFQRLGKVYSETDAKREYFGHPALAEVGLYYSTRSRDWYGRENPAKYHVAVWGAHRALVQSHIPMGFVIEENLSLEQLRRFPVVYLPGAAILSEREAAIFDQYVSDGGNLLVTGISGQYDKFGTLQKTNTLQKLLGVETEKCVVENSDNFVRLPPALADGEARFLGQDVPWNWFLLTWGPAVACKPTRAKAFGELLAAYRTAWSQWSNHLSPKEVVGPAVFINRHGKGTVIYVPAAIDSAFASDYRMPEHRNLIANLVRHLSPNPAAVVTAPRNVEITITRDAARKRSLVHFLSFTAPPTYSAYNFGEGARVLPPMMEENARYTAEVKLNRPFLNVRALGPDTKITRDGNVVRLETANIHDILVCGE